MWKGTKVGVGGVDNASAIKWTSALMYNASGMWEFRTKRNEKGKSYNVDFQWVLAHPIMTRLEIALTGEQTCHRRNLLIYGDTGSSFSCTHWLVAEGYILSLCWWIVWHFSCPPLRMLPLKHWFFVHTPALQGKEKWKKKKGKVQGKIEKNRK